jgi:hypothetical protein
MAKNLLHCETGFGVYRSTQLGHIPFFLITISVGWPKYNHWPRNAIPTPLDVKGHTHTQRERKRYYCHTLGKSQNFRKSLLTYSEL